MRGDNEDPRVKFRLFYQGLVQDNVDPEKLGRVRVQIPGLREVTSWALPVGFPGAGVGKGLFAVPDVGTNVVVGFIQGEESMPFYLCGPWGAQLAPSEIPREAANQEPADVHKVYAYESDTFEIFINEKDDERKLVLRTKTGDEEIEIDANDRSISIKATNWIIVEAGGVSINGTKLQLGGRVVQKLGEAI